MKQQLGRRLLALTLTLSAALCPAALAASYEADGLAMTGGTAMIQKLNWTRSTKGLTVTDENGPALPIGKGGAIAPGGHSSCPSARFTDLDTAQWYHEYTDAMIEGGYMSGAGETFDPNGQLTRGMLVTILWRMEGRPSTDAACPFDDVAENDYFSDAVRWAASLELVRGESDTAFAPDDAISRQELAAILWRLAAQKGLNVSNAGSTVPDFADRDQIASWAGEAVSWAYTCGILTGRSGNRLDPAGTATRAEAAAMLVRFGQLKPPASPEGQVKA